MSTSLSYPVVPTGDSLTTNRTGICATLSQEAKDKSDEKMDLADAVGADDSCRVG
ncbi:hypothetical protein [Nostoc sp.]|uniref:hypothetical protein n=1 Tax=Nostoc sp. TaxID=1180 RepID=UPI002FF5E8BD